MVNSVEYDGSREIIRNVVTEYLKKMDEFDMDDAVEEFKSTDQYKNLPETDKKRNPRQNNANYNAETTLEISYEFVQGRYQMAFCDNTENIFSVSGV